jgi:hypothetical protein
MAEDYYDKLNHIDGLLEMLAEEHQNNLNKLMRDFNIKKEAIMKQYGDAIREEVIKRKLEEK